MASFSVSNLFHALVTTHPVSGRKGRTTVSSLGITQDRGSLHFGVGLRRHAGSQIAFPTTALESFPLAVYTGDWYLEAIAAIFFGFIQCGA